MMDSLKSLLFGVHDHARLTERMPNEHVAVAALLLEVAEAGSDSGQEERRLITELLSERFSLSRPEVDGLLRTAQQVRETSSDLWPFTHAIAQAYGPEQKLRLLEMVWRVVFADGRLDPYEDLLTHRLQTMLSVNHSVLMEAKHLAREATGRSNGHA